MPQSRAENPVLPDEAPTRPEWNKGVSPERPQELVDRLEEIEQQDLTGQDRTKPRPYSLPGEDEGPLGEGGQFREPDAGGGGSS